MRHLPFLSTQSTINKYPELYKYSRLARRSGMSFFLAESGSECPQIGQIRDFFRSDFSTYLTCTQFWSENVTDLSDFDPLLAKIWNPCRLLRGYNIMWRRFLILWCLKPKLSKSKWHRQQIQEVKIKQYLPRSILTAMAQTYSLSLTTASHIIHRWRYQYCRGSS